MIACCSESDLAKGHQLPHNGARWPVTFLTSYQIPERSRRLSTVQLPLCISGETLLCHELAQHSLNHPSRFRLVDVIAHLLTNLPLRQPRRFSQYIDVSIGRRGSCRITKPINDAKRVNALGDSIKESLVL